MDAVSQIQTYSASLAKMFARALDNLAARSTPISVKDAAELTALLESLQKAEGDAPASAASSSSSSPSSSSSSSSSSDSASSFSSSDALRALAESAQVSPGLPASIPLEEGSAAAAIMQQVADDTYEIIRRVKQADALIGSLPGRFASEEEQLAEIAQLQAACEAADREFAERAGEAERVRGHVAATLQQLTHAVLDTAPGGGGGGGEGGEEGKREHNKR